MAGVILGDWTHRRGDGGGSRAVSADVRRAKPRVVWTWSPPHGGRIDQVRIAGGRVFAATAEPHDRQAPGWEHAVVFALDASRGRAVAIRALPDPVPTAAMVVDGDAVHVVATRPGEPIFWYALRTADLQPLHRRAIGLAEERPDVLDAWASSDGGLWLEAERGAGQPASFVYVPPSDPGARLRGCDVEGTRDAEAGPCDAACMDRTLYVPYAGPHAEVRRLGPGEPGTTLLGQTDALAGEVHAHALAANGLIDLVAFAWERRPERDSALSVQALAVDRVTAVVRRKTPVASFTARDEPVGARLVRLRGGQVLVQASAADGSPCADLVGILPDGPIEAISLGARRPYILDLALGDTLVAHRRVRGERVLVGVFDVVRAGRWLGGRASALWSLEVPAPGGFPAIYAGAGLIVVRSERELVAIQV